LTAEAKTLQTFNAVAQSAEAVDTTRVLLRDLIDYAGLFPPAALAMLPAVANYDLYTRSKCSWILGRFIVQVARLGEFEKAFAGLPAPEHEPSSTIWRLSALLGDDVAADIASIREFNARMATHGSGRSVVVEAVEVKAASPDEVISSVKIIPTELDAYFEVPLWSGGECIAAISDCGRRAKIRTGGETADKFPSSENVIEFIRLCAAANVPFKATAGLHHPLRSVHRFTYQLDSASGIMHGFLNVFLAAAFLRAGMKTDLSIELLDEQSVEALHFDSDGIVWRQHRLSRHEIIATRRDFAISFGSCSFTEPIDDLRSLHLL
jgi:hypothetical protein